MRPRTFALTVGAVTAAALLTIAAANLVIDPLAQFGTGRFEPLVLHARKIKTSLIQEKHRKTEAFILGSSRVWKFEPSYVEELTGKRTFNLGVNSASIEDFYLLLRFLIDEANPTLLIVGLDEVAFHENRPILGRTFATPALARYLEPAHRRQKIPWLFETAVGWETFAQTIRSIRYHLTEFPPPWGSFEDDGSLNFHALEARIRDGTHNLGAEIENTKIEYRTRLSGFEAIPEWRLRYFDRFVQTAVDHGIEVYFVLTPLHPELRRFLRRVVPIDHQLQMVRELVGEAAAAHGFGFFDASDPLIFGSEMADAFYDGVHPRAELTRKILDELIR
jgi:hypothetical protein